MRCADVAWFTGLIMVSNSQARSRSPNPGLVHVPLVGAGHDVRGIAPTDVLAALEIAIAPREGSA